MNRPRVVAIVQARMGSTRLPGKVLADIAGRPMLAWVVERARHARRVAEVVVATTTDAGDDPVADLCAGRGFACVRGHPTDVLDRYVQAARQFAAGVIVRLTGDCPLTDPALIDQAVQAFESANPPVDLVANRLPDGRTFPIGLDIEVCSRQALEQAWREADQPYQREHVMPYLYEVPGRFRVLRLDHDPDYGLLRWAVDTPEDLEVVRRIMAHFGGQLDVGWTDVVELMQADPSLMELNATVHHKGYRDVG
jgi:spore coat polysaccharide biosynthesis protein SpsF